MQISKKDLFKHSSTRTLMASIIASCTLVMIGCGEAPEDEGEPAPSSHTLTRGQAISWDVAASYDSWANELDVWFDARKSGVSYKVCWKRSSDSGRPCSHNKTSLTTGGTGFVWYAPTSSKYGWGRQQVTISTNLQCTNYLVRVKRDVFSYQDTVVSGC